MNVYGSGPFLLTFAPRFEMQIAHLDPDSTMIVADRWDDLQKVEQALPGLRWIARQLLDAELQEHR
jgi:hypothetical protein